MRSITFNEANRSDNLLHIETPLGIVNIRIGLHDGQGRPVESIEVIPNEYAGEPRVGVDGYRNTRLVQETDDAPFCPACGSVTADCEPSCPCSAETFAAGELTMKGGEA